MGLVSASVGKGLVRTLLDLPLFHAEWVLWLLVLISLVTVAVIIERGIFYWRHSVDLDHLRGLLTEHISSGDFEGAARLLEEQDSLESNVVLFGLTDYSRGPDSVEDLLAGAMHKEKQRYDRRLLVLATVAANAPFIGLFGTVLGIIRAFKDLAGNMAEASSAVMAGIAEALIATAVGLLVAIPAVIAFNFFKGKVRHAVTNAQLLSRILLAHLKGVDPEPRAGMREE